MNKKISLVLVVVFVLVFSGFFLFNDTFLKISKDKFYSQEFDSSKKKILIYGSSHLIQLNSTHISEQIVNASENHSVFNVAENGDTPKKRSLNIDRDLQLEPQLVIYGVGFRDFSAKETIGRQEEDAHLRNEFGVADLIPFDTTEAETLNPKLTTLQVLRSFTMDLMKTGEKPDMPYANTPVFSVRIQDEIADFDACKPYYVCSESVQEFLITEEDNEQLSYFKKIIKKLQENDVKVVVMTTPYHISNIEKIPDVEKRIFYQILSNIEDEFDVKVYDYNNKYDHLPIWRDGSHIAFNEKAIVFSDDVAQMIIQEIEE